MVSRCCSLFHCAQKVVGTDIFHAAALLYVAGFGHLVAGNVDIRVVAWLLLGSIPGVILGSHWMMRLPEGWIRIALAVVLLLSGLKLAGIPGATIIIAAGLGGGAVVLFGLVLRDRWRRRRPRSEPIPLTESEPWAGSRRRSS